MEKWKKISVEEAKLHPLYGIKGWLLLFAIGPLFGSLITYGQINNLAHKLNLSVTKFLAIDSPEVIYIEFSLWMNIALTTVIYILMITKNSDFRKIVSFMLLGAWPTLFLYGQAHPYSGIGSDLSASFLSWIIYCVVWVTYINKSRRVRVTFENAILNEDTSRIHVPVEHRLNERSAPFKESLIPSYLNQLNKSKQHHENESITNFNTNQNDLIQKSKENDKHEKPTERVIMKTDGRVLGDYGVCIPQGVYLQTGHVRLEHNTQYSLLLRNYGNKPCDAEINIDGSAVGIWRVPIQSEIEIERPIDDNGRFTFYALESQQGRKIGLTGNDELGLVTVVFIPEKNTSDVYGNSKPQYSSRTPLNLDERGGTGLSGQSSQKFGNATGIDRDFESTITIHLRLVCGDNEPRSLKKRSTSVPSFLPDR